MSKGKFLHLWQKSVIAPTAILKEALQAISAAGAFMACATDGEGRLVGIVTDSDVRRALVSGAKVEDPLGSWLRTNPITAPDTASVAELLEIARANDVREIPLVDDQGRLADIFVLLSNQMRMPLHHELLARVARPKLPNPMLILAGGLGTRLRPVVNDRPKPLALVGDRPILETLIMRAVESGIATIYVSVNYMAPKIEEHLRTARYQGLDIRILKEEGRLGTAGSLSLLPEGHDVAVLVCNADILTTMPFDALIHHHNRHKADVTCAVRPYETIVPFGVFELARGQITGIREKPVVSYMVNSGIYVIEPAVCRMVPKAAYFDMPKLITDGIAGGKKIVPFLLHEYWRDIGQPDDFNQANLEYSQFFGES